MKLVRVLLLLIVVALLLPATAVAQWAMCTESAAGSLAAGERRTPPNCSEYCSSEGACEDECWSAGTTTCGDYGVCISCESACNPYQSCQMQCLDGGLSSCNEHPPCGGTFSNCDTVCASSTVPCWTTCTDNGQGTTCGAESYTCTEPCDEEGLYAVGVTEENPQQNGEYTYVDCVMHQAWLRRDSCTNLPDELLECVSSMFLATQLQGICCDTWAGQGGGCGNPYNCYGRKR